MSYGKIHSSFVRNQIWGYNPSQSVRKWDDFICARLIKCQSGNKNTFSVKFLYLNKKKRLNFPSISKFIFFS